MSKSATMGKDKLLDLIHTERRRLEKNIESLTNEQKTKPGVVDNWSVKDLMAHLTVWEQRMLSWWKAQSTGKGDPETAADLDLHAYNERVYELNRNRPLDEITEEFESSYQEILNTLEHVSEIQLNTPVEYEWANGVSWWELVAFNTYRHYRWAKDKIREWMKNHAS